MKLDRIENMKGGWFIGNFDPTVLKTELFEVSYKIHKKGEIWDIHYHHTCKEINLLIHGDMIMQDIRLKPGDIFILEPFEIADPEFIEECEIICVKIPSIDDKISVTKKLSKIDFRKFIKINGNNFIQIGSNNGINNENCGIREEILEHENNVILIEPVPEFFNELKENYKYSKSNISFENCAISDDNNDKKIYLNGVESSLIIKRDENDFIIVKCKTIHQIIEDYKINHIDGLFIDAEGCEYLILKNLFEKENIPTINLIRYEFILNEKMKEIDELLIEKGFTIYLDLIEAGDKVAINNNILKKIK